MKKCPAFATMLPTLLLIGCSSTSPLTIEEHGEPIAQSIGTEVTNLKFISPGDFAPFDEVAGGFNPITKGTVVLTEDAIYWREGQGVSTQANPFEHIPLSKATGVAADQNVLQLRIGDELHVLRLTEWNPYQSNKSKAEVFLGLLREHQIPQFAVVDPFNDHPIARNSPYNQVSKQHSSHYTERVHVTDSDGNTTMKTVTRTYD